MKRILNILIVLLFSIASQAQEDEIIKDTYQDKMNGQTTVIIKDSTSTDVDVLNQLDLDDYTVGQEVRITEDMIAELNRRERIKALGYDPQAKEKEEGKSETANPIPPDEDIDVIDVGIITPSTNLGGLSDDDPATMIQMLEDEREGGEGDNIFIRKNPAPAKFLELIKTKEYQEKLEKLKASGELIFV